MGRMNPNATPEQVEEYNSLITEILDENDVLERERKIEKIETDYLLDWTKAHSHPFLGTQPRRTDDDSYVFIMKTKNSSSGNLAFSIEKHLASQRADSVEEIEKKYLSYFEDLDEPASSFAKIKRASVKIARDSRRGMGNVLVHNPGDRNMIVDLTSGFDTRFTLVERDYVEAGTAYVIYKSPNNEFDAPAVWSPAPLLDTVTHAYFIDEELAHKYGLKINLNGGRDD